MATIIVTNTNDSGEGSLRAAINTAQSGDTIKFVSSLTNQTISLSSQLDLPRTITIDGAGTPGLTISGSNKVRVFQLITRGITANIRNLTIANGRATTGTGTERAGAAIRGGNTTTLNIDNVDFNNNVAGFAGAILTGFTSTNTITNSRFDSNSGALDGVERGGGAVSTTSNSKLTVIGSTFTNNRGTNGGAINHLLGELTIEDSIFTNNDTIQGTGGNTNGYGGAVYVDGANASGPDFGPGPIGGKITIRNSEFIDNAGIGQGGGLFLFLKPGDELLLEDSLIIGNRLLKGSTGDSIGGGVRIGNGLYTVRNTTIANNIAEEQGGGLWVGEIAPGTIENSTFFGNQTIDSDDSTTGIGGGLMFATDSPQKVTNVTIASNQAGGEGGGIVGSRNVTLTNTIVANNTANNPFGIKQNASSGLGFDDNPPPIFSDGGGNIEWPPITDNFNNPNLTATVLQADPKLGNLQDNGNGVLTVPLIPGSAAIDTGVNSSAPATDQRGQSRPIDGDGNGSAIADSGAVEFNGTPTKPTPPDEPTTPDEPTNPVSETNPAPQLESIQKSVPEDSIISFSPTDFTNAFSDDEDENNNLRAIRVISLPASGELTLNGTAITTNSLIEASQLAQLQYAPETNQNGEISFQASAQDDGSGNNESAPATVALTLIPVNDAPSFSLIDSADQRATPGQAVTVENFVAQISAGAENESGQTLAFNLDTQRDEFFSQLPQLGTNGTLTYRIASGASGSSTVNIRLLDDGGVENGGSDTSTVSRFTITATPSASPAPGNPSKTAPAKILFEDSSNNLSGNLFFYDLTPAGEGTPVVAQLAIDMASQAEASFDNLIGLYEISDTKGGIDTNNDGTIDLRPNDQAAYAEYAITNRISDFAIRGGSSGDPARNTTLEQFGDILLEGGKLYAPFLLVNGGEMGFEGFIAAENRETDGIFNDAANFISDQVLYFGIATANPDGAKHLKSLGNDVFGFEDLASNLGVSDNDFNDAIFKLNFATV